jgi:hypothetical protein
LVTVARATSDQLELDGCQSHRGKFQQHYVHFCTFRRNEIAPAPFSPSVVRGKITVIGKLYFVRQAATLLKFARSTANPELSAVLIEKAAELKSRVDGEASQKESLKAPDVEPEADRGLRGSAGWPS